MNERQIPPGRIHARRAGDAASCIRRRPTTSHAILHFKCSNFPTPTSINAVDWCASIQTCCVHDRVNDRHNFSPAASHATDAYTNSTRRSSATGRRYMPGARYSTTIGSLCVPSETRVTKSRPLRGKDLVGSGLYRYWPRLGIDLNNPGKTQLRRVLLPGCLALDRVSLQKGTIDKEVLSKNETHRVFVSSISRQYRNKSSTPESFAALFGGRIIWSMVNKSELDKHKAR